MNNQFFTLKQGVLHYPRYVFGTFLYTSVYIYIYSCNEQPIFYLKNKESFLTRDICLKRISSPCFLA